MWQCWRCLQLCCLQYFTWLGKWQVFCSLTDKKWHPLESVEFDHWKQLWTWYLLESDGHMAERDCYSVPTLSILCLGLLSGYTPVFPFLLWYENIRLRSSHNSLSQVVLWSRITPFGFVCLSVFLFFVIGCFACFLITVHISQCYTLLGGFRSLTWCWWSPGQESAEDHQGNPAPILQLPL